MSITGTRLVPARSLKAYETSGRVHNVAYMIDPIADAYGILFMRSLSPLVEGDCVFDRYKPCCI
ncbi:hypothetical protein A2U01_0099477, partial [Trifolium medium]|nr:hypothetical protein [Trifolium medium]